MNLNLIRLPRLLAKTGLPKTTIYDGIREGLLTRGVSIGARAVAWPEHEVDAINAARIAGKSDAEIRDLVQRLMAKRATALEGLAA